MGAKVSLSLEDTPPGADVPIWERSPEERVAAHLFWQTTCPPVEGVALDDSREGIYGDDWRG